MMLRSPLLAALSLLPPLPLLLLQLLGPERRLQHMLLLSWRLLQLLPQEHSRIRASTRVVVPAGTCAAV